ncbi:MAG: ribosome-associated translation inhibitor RaiA [Pacificimonas sp.]|jgi:ribosomal subunit interface protein|nr:ribosome-associated translation inhibitor RaiA [Pacificimonas sp.]
MDIRISGHQLDVGDALTAHAEAKIADLAEKFTVGVTGATITFAPGPHEHEFDATIVMQLSQGLIMKSHAHAFQSARASFDGAAERIEKQLRRYKRKLRDRARTKPDPAAIAELDSTYRVLQATPEADEVPEDDAPLIIADMAESIPQVTVSDAVMLLDLKHTPALMFRNAQTEALNMVYRRDDGHIGWVEPK